MYNKSIKKESANASITVEQDSLEDLPPIVLLEPELDNGKSVLKALKQRKTIREINDKKLSLQALSNGYKQPGLQDQEEIIFHSEPFELICGYTLMKKKIKKRETITNFIVGYLVFKIFKSSLFEETGYSHLTLNSTGLYNPKSQPHNSF
jgi:hypothetical protein